MNSGESRELSVAVIGIFVAVIAMGIELFLFGITARVGVFMVNFISVAYASAGLAVMLVGMYYVRQQRLFMKKQQSSQPSPPIVVQLQFPSLMKIEANVKIDGEPSVELSDMSKEGGS